MSHRRPLTRPDRLFDSILAKHPELRDMRPGYIDAFSNECLSMCSEALGVMLTPTKAAISRYMHDKNMLKPEMVAVYSRWRTCRHVYRFDKNLSNELNGMSVPRDMPLDTLDMLPYPIIYVETKVPYHTVMCNEIEVFGFFVWVENEKLIVLFDTANGLVVIMIDLGAKTIGEMVDGIVHGDNEMYGTFGIELSDRYEDVVFETAVSIVGHLLYIISDNSEQEVVYRPSGTTKRTNKTSQSTIHNVGTRVGRKLGAARVRTIGKRATRNGGTVAPHIRAAHWHHYWTGPRNEPEKRKLIVRWIEPVFVGTGEPDTVIHKS